MSQHGDHIWVAGGRYIGATAAAPIVEVSGMTLHLVGGFGATEATIGERPWPLELTTLDGDFDGDGFNPGVPSTMVDNAQNVVRVTDGEVTVAGFTLTGGKGRPDETVFTPPDIHAAFDATRATIRVAEARIHANDADRGAAGGGVQATVVVARTTIEGNTGAGAVLSFTGSSVALSDVKVVGNPLAALSMTDGTLAVWRSWFQGGLSATGAFYLSGVDTRLYDTDFVGNDNIGPTSSENGSALTVKGADGSLLAVDVAFLDNDGGIGAISVISAPTTLTNMTAIENNPASGGVRGGALTGCDAVIEIRNALFQSNGSTDVARRTFAPGGPPTCATGAPTVSSSVSNLVLPGSGNTLAAGVATALPSGEVVLRSTGAGVDVGASAPAEDPLRGYPAFGGVWGQRASTDAFVPDEPPIDPGRHYARDSAVILVFDLESDLATWEVGGARRCELSVDGASALVIDAPSTGESSIIGLTGDDVVLRCESTWGGHAAEARGVLP